MSNTKRVKLMVANYEIPLGVFTDIVRYCGKYGIWGSPSHAQSKPDEINHSAILKWQLDKDGLYADTISGKRVRLSKTMPAMKLVLVEELGEP